MTEETRQELDPMFKQVVVHLLSSLPVTVQTEVEVSRLPRKIDVIVEATTEEARAQLRENSPFRHLRTYNQIEFKGRRDPLTQWDFLQILGRAHFYMAENKIEFAEMSVTIVCAGKPRTVLQRQAERFTLISDGVYRRSGVPETTLIVINELPVTPENYPLLVFASSKRKFRAFVEQMLTENRGDYVVYAYQVRPQETKELLRMAGVYSIPRENLEFIAQDIGDELVTFIKPEVRVQGMRATERLPDIDEITMEELQALSAKIADEARRRMLQATKSAEERITAVEEMSGENRTFLFDEKNRTQLLSGLDENEQAKMLEWLNLRNDL